MIYQSNWFTQSFFRNMQNMNTIKACVLKSYSKAENYAAWSKILDQFSFETRLLIYFRIHYVNEINRIFKNSCVSYLCEISH